MKKRKLSINPAYRKFKKDADVALETLLDGALLDISDALGTALSSIEDAASSAAAKSQDGFYGLQAQQAEQAFHQKLKQAFQRISLFMAHRMEKLSTQSYLLAYVAEKEAIGRALDEDQTYNNPKTKTADLSAQGEPLLARVELSLWKLEQKIMQAYKLARIQELPVSEFIDKVKSSFPRKKALPKRNTVLLQGTLQEADIKAKVKTDTGEVISGSFSSGVLDEEQWSQIVDQLLGSHEMYMFRRPEFAPDKIYVPSKDKEVYLWELEQEATQGFVDEVRDARKDSSESSGIKDFIWLAILDDKTDECCAWRDGLTVTEIEHRLKTDKKDDECKGATPPIHFNCRCDLVPLSDNVKEESPPSGERFDEWLQS